MKKIIIIISIFAMLNTQAFAKERGFVDVFEEAAVASDDDIKTFPISVEGEKNGEISGNFNCIGDNICWVEISFYPKHGRLEVDGSAMTFTYIPNKGFTGKDRFYYKVSDGRYTSNVSECNIKIKNTSASGKLSTFGYNDMNGNKSEYAAVKLVEADILRGERIGKNHYFHPNAFVKRSTAAGCIYRLSKLYCRDSAEAVGAFGGISFSESLENMVYYACRSGIIYGEGCVDGTDLRLDDVVTRAEFLCMLDRAIGVKCDGGNPKFDDLSEIPDFAMGSVKRLYAVGIVDDNNTVLKPNEPLTKGEMAELIYRCMCYEERKSEKSISQKITEKLYPEICV